MHRMVLLMPREDAPELDSGTVVRLEKPIAEGDDCGRGVVTLDIALGRGGPPFLDGLGGSPVGRRGRVHVGSGVQVLSRCQVPSEERGGGVVRVGVRVQFRLC